MPDVISHNFLPLQVSLVVYKDLSSLLDVPDLAGNLSMYALTFVRVGDEPRCSRRDSWVEVQV